MLAYALKCRFKWDDSHSLTPFLQGWEMLLSLLHPALVFYCQKGVAAPSQGSV